MPNQYQTLIVALRRFVNGILKEYNCSQQDIRVRFLTHYRPDLVRISLTALLEYKSNELEYTITISDHNLLNDETKEYERIVEHFEPVLVQFIEKSGIGYKTLVTNSASQPLRQLILL